MADETSTIYIRLDSSQYEGAVKTVESFNEKLDATIDRLIDSILKLGKSFDDVAKHVAGMSSSAQKAATDVANLESQFKKFEAMSKKIKDLKFPAGYQDAFQKFGATIGKSESDMQRWLPVLNKVERAIAQQSMVMDANNKKGKVFYENADRFGLAQGVLSERLKVTSSGIVRVTDSFSSLSDKYAKYNAETIKSVSHTKAYQDAFDRLGETYGKTEASMQMWLPQLNKVEAGIQKQAMAMNMAGKDGMKYYQTADRIATMQDVLSGNLKITSRGFEETVDKFKVLEPELTKYQLEAGKAASATNAYQEAFARLGNAYGKTEADMARWLPQLNRVEAAIQKQSMAMDAAGQGGREYYETTDRIKTMQDVLSGKLKITSQGFEDMAAKAKKAAEKARQFPLAYQDAFNKMAKSGADMKTWLPTLNKVEAAIQKQSHAMNMAGKDGNAYYQTTDRIATMQDVMAGRLRITSDGFKEATEEVNKKKRGLQHLLPHVFAVTAAYMSMRTALRGFVEMAKTGVDFEHQMAIVGSIVRATSIEFDALQKAAIEAGETTVWTASEAADALRYLGMAGFRAAEAIEALPGVLNLALIGTLDLGRATDIASDTLVALGMQVSELDRVVDVFTGTITRTNTNIEMMGQAMKFTAPIAGQLGYSVEQVSAMIGILAQSGIKAGIAGRGLQMSFNKVTEVANRLGLDAGVNLIDVLKELERQQISVSEISTMFGMNALKTILVLKENISQYERLVGVLENAGGEAQDFVTSLDTVHVSFRLLKSVIQSIAIESFNRYRDSLKDVVDAATEFFQEHKDTIVSTIEAIGTLIKYGVDLVAHIAIIKGVVWAWKLGMAEAAVATDILSTSQTRLATAVKAASAAFMSFLPYLAAYAALKLVEKLYSDHKAFEDLIEAENEFQKKWNDLRDLEPIDLAAKLKGGEGFKKPIEEARELIAKYEDQVRNSISWNMIFSLDPVGYYKKNIEPMLQKIEETKKSIAELEYAEFLGKAGIVAPRKESASSYEAESFDQQLERWKRITHADAFVMASRGEITDAMVDDMKKYLPALEELSKTSDEAGQKHKELSDIINKIFVPALRAVADGYGVYEDSANSAAEADQRALEIRQRVLDTLGGEKAAQDYYDELDLIRKVEKELSEETANIFGGKSLHELDPKAYEAVKNARIKALKDSKTEEEKALEDIEKSYKKMLEDRMLEEEDFEAYVSAKWDHLLAKYEGNAEVYKKIEEVKFDELRKLQEKALGDINKEYDKMVVDRAKADGTYEQIVTAKWDALLQKYRDDAEMYKKIEELKQFEIQEIRDKAIDDEGRKAKERAEVYREITEDLKGLDYTHYKFQMQLLDLQYQEYLKVLGKEKEALALLNRWRVEQAKELWKEDVKNRGDFFETMQVAAVEFADENLNLSQKMFGLWEKTFTDIDKTMADTFVDSALQNFDTIGDAWKALVDEMKRDWLRLVYYVLRNEVIARFGSSLTLQSIGMGAASNAISTAGTSIATNAAATGPITQGAFWEQTAMASAGAGGAASAAGKVGTLSAIGAGLSTFGQGALVGAGHLFSGGSAFMPTATNAMGAGMSLGYYGPLAAAGYFGGNYFSKNVLGQHGRYGGLGGAAGAIIGQALIPIPGVGALIGGLVGSAIGGIGPDKYKHAGMYSMDLTDFLDRYENLNDAPEGVRKLKTLLDSFESSLDGLPDWMGGRYESDIEGTIDAIEDMDLTVWANRYRDIAGNMGEAANVIAEAFTVGLDNVDAQTRETVLSMLNMGQEVPEALEVGLANWQEKVASYYQNVVDTAADIFGQGLTDAFSVLPNMKWDTLTSSLFHGLANEIATAITSATVESTIIKNLIEPFITGIDTTREGSMVVTGYDTKAASKAFAKTLSDEPVFDIAAYERSVEKESGQRLSAFWYNISEDKRADLVKQYAPDLYKKYTRSSDRDIFNTMSSSAQINYMKNKGFDLSPYEITKFDPLKFQKGVDAYIKQLKSDLQEMEPYLKAVADAQAQINQVLFAEEYKTQREAILKDMDYMVRDLRGEITDLDKELMTTEASFTAWIDQLTALGASQAQITRATNLMNSALQAVEDNFNSITGAASELSRNLIDEWIMPVVESWKSFMDDMLISDMAPVQSYETYQGRYDDLLAAAQTGGADAVQSLFDYVKSEYLPFMQEYTAEGADYRELWDSLFGTNGQLSNFNPQITVDTDNISEEITAAIRESMGDVVESIQEVNGSLQIVLKLDNTTMGTYIADLIRNNGEVREAVEGV